MFWKKLNTQIRNVCLAIQIKKNSHFRFRSPFSFQKLLFWPKFSQFSIFFSFFLFKGKKVVYTSFQREIPCSRPLHVFFSPKTPLLTKVQWINMQDVAQIGFFLFYKEKILFTAGFRGKFPTADFWTKLDNSCLDYTFNFLFFSSTSTSFERSRLHRVLRNCGSADRGTSENSVNMQICSCWALGEIEWFAWKWTFPFSVFKMLGLVLNKHKLTPLKWLFFCIA